MFPFETPALFATMSFIILPSAHSREMCRGVAQQKIYGCCGIHSNMLLSPISSLVLGTGPMALMLGHEWLLMVSLGFRLFALLESRALYMCLDRL